MDPSFVVCNSLRFKYIGNAKSTVYDRTDRKFQQVHLRVPLLVAMCKKNWYRSETRQTKENKRETLLDVESWHLI